MESISRAPAPDCLKLSYTPPNVWRPKAPIWEVVFMKADGFNYGHEQELGHLCEIKWRGIFNLLPSEEGGKLREREVNLATMMVMVMTLK